jgi:hypothetical protein
MLVSSVLIYFFIEGALQIAIARLFPWSAVCKIMMSVLSRNAPRPQFIGAIIINVYCTCLKIGDLY